MEKFFEITQITKWWTFFILLMKNIYNIGRCSLWLKEWLPVCENLKASQIAWISRIYCRFDTYRMPQSHSSVDSCLVWTVIMIICSEYVYIQQLSCIHLGIWNVTTQCNRIWSIIIGVWQHEGLYYFQLSVCSNKLVSRKASFIQCTSFWLCSNHSAKNIVISFKNSFSCK